MMLRTRAYACLLVVPFVLIAGTGHGDTTEILGVAKDNVTGQPIANATVILWETHDTTLTDGTGGFYFPVMPTGGGTIIVGSSGYGAFTGFAITCFCPHQNDMNDDGFVDSIDLSLVIDAVFFGGLDPSDAGCPNRRGDFDADGFTDSIDLSVVIDHVFFGGSPPADPCVAP